MDIATTVYGYGQERPIYTIYVLYGEDPALIKIGTNSLFTHA